MDANVVATGDRAVISLSGRFDFNAHREFRDAADQAIAMTDAREIQIDLAGVDYLDSSALGMLLMLRDKAKGVGKSVTLANCRGAVKQVIEIANFSKLFPVS
jgi:anti-anti-sigma factor